VTWAREWFTAAELAAEGLPGMPSTERGWQKKAERESWETPARENYGWRNRSGKGGGVEYHVSNLTAEQRAQIALKYFAAPERGPCSSELWDKFEARPEKVKAKARERLTLTSAVYALEATGVPKVEAIKKIFGDAGISKQTFYNWEKPILLKDRYHHTHLFE
jgi:hypothetical protein